MTLNQSRETSQLEHLLTMLKMLPLMAYLPPRVVMLISMLGGDVVIMTANMTEALAYSFLRALPDSLSTGGLLNKIILISGKN